jgi:hypothetical protein
MTLTSKHTRAALEQRLAALEETQRQTRAALEQAATRGLSEGAQPLNTPTKVLTETYSRIRNLMRFKTLAFFLVHEPGGEFYLARSFPPSKAPDMEDALHQMVESGSAAWALRRNRPVFLSAPHR